MKKIEVIKVEYNNPEQGQDLLHLLNEYACDPMGGDEPLSDHCQQDLVQNLAQVPGAASFIAYVEGQPAGLVNTFMAFSTFKCKPLINIHDVVVLKAYRGLGISLTMLQFLQDYAVNQGCCKLTLEVLQGNEVAKKAYQKFGFSSYELDPEMGQAVFWQKEL